MKGEINVTNLVAKVLAPICLGLLCGCSTTSPMYGNILTPAGGDTPKIRFMKLSDPSGTVYAWDTGSNVAYVNKEGKTCVVASVLAKGSKLNVNADVIDKVKADANFATQLLKLQEKDAASTMLDIGMFHVCMLTNNGVGKSDIDSFLEKFKVMIVDIYKKEAEEKANSDKPSASTQ